MHIHREIENLKKEIIILGSMVEEAIRRAFAAIDERSIDKAQEVINGDVLVDIKELEIDETCLKTLALYQPVAEDLRFLTVVMKINNELENMADLAADVAERAAFLAENPPVPVPPQLGPMSQATMKMVGDSLDAFVNGDLELGKSIRDQDDQVDQFNREILSAVYDFSQQHPDQIRSAMQIFSIAGYLEQIADRATGIGEDVVYMITGEDIRHRRKIQRSKVQSLQKGQNPGE
ncbi:MAG: phosphate signaling complex protein PhoU [Planctomycetota bacterium]|nr:phosphate signaling complex protein PhoU [Planctomycetota bacterium]MDA1142842.1 phosphate signaling complex protein PhoU [Planctomycetota bacterium]